MFYTEWECDFFFLFFVWILYVRKVVLWRILILLICIEALRTSILIFHTDANAVSVTILYCALPFLSPSAQPFGISHFGRVFRVRAPRPRLSPPDNAQRIQNTHPHSLGPPAFAVLSHQRKISRCYPSSPRAHTRGIARAIRRVPRGAIYPSRTTRH